MYSSLKTNILDTYYAIRNFFTNLWRFRKELASYYPWDYFHMENFLKRHLELYLKDYENCSFAFKPESLKPENLSDYEKENLENLKEQVRAKYLSAKLALKLLNRLYEDKYYTKKEKELEDIYGNLSVNWEKTEDRKFFTTFFTYGKVGRSEEASEAFLNLYIMQNKRQERDRQLVYKIMAKYASSWWN